MMLAVSLLASSQYSKEQERKADRIVKPSARLSRAAALSLRDFFKSEENHEKFAKMEWNSLRTEFKPTTKTPISVRIDSLIANSMNESQYVAFSKEFMFAPRHPLPSERIAYFETWAQEAEAKKLGMKDQKK